MLEQEYILLIMNCKRYRDKAIQQKQSWLKNISSRIVYFHVIGDPLLDDDNGYYFDYNEKVLYVQTEDDYISLPKKVFAAYKAILDTYQFKYIFKTDDDQNLVNENFLNTLMNVLDNKAPRVHYGGKVVDVEVPYLSEYYKIHPELPKNIIINPTKYCSGRFYFLSWDAIFSLSSKKESIEKEYMEDYAFGLNLSSFLKETIMNLTTDKYFIDF
jgi:hypothetical protein